ncbi:hypothetical protein [Pseudorhodoplanes sinuspersici]|uniref:Uncharacterized protein n=1 Tax=Pseudorhodoplanes sinuspersici TaxID=1235591 RepID=A0A1W6ZX45_9HYPH|nr:hypothetical protein [Pseudorhodoplanes sinuspersici]ARQ01880.1 hypothetical protein CAK95_24370 [Pseudorhodoplanes sinuspersici]RKE73645.1 hypothetical protein DFP91_1539 [Pseudorhodoplanes sinuspersici]
MAGKLTYVEIDIDRCALSYGVAPCVASIPETGDRKCFNSIGSCQDRANFDDEGVTIRFAINAGYLPADIECIPCIKSESDIEFTPCIVSLGVDLGQRASLKIRMLDHPDSDTGPAGDKYLSERPYNPFKQGTYFGKFRARHPYLRGRNLRLIRGEVGQALGDMETRHFIIDSFDGPLPDGTFSIIAKDVLKLADGDRAQAPRVSNGFLTAAISNSDLAFTLSPAGIGNAEYPSSGYGAIGGKEIVAFTRSGNSVTITGRAQFGTTAVAHDAQDRFQLVLRYDAVDPANIVKDLLQNYADVPSGYIPIADWLDETGNFFNRLFTAVIPEPTDVSKLLSEIIEQAALAVWWDDRQQKIRLQVLRSIATDASRFSEVNTLKDSIQSKEQPDKRVSEVITYFGQNNPLRPVDDADNFRSIETVKDDQSAADYGSPAIKKIFSRWMPPFGRTVATRNGQIILGRYKNPPRRLNFDVFRDGIALPALGQGARVVDWFIQDDTGAPADVPIQITRINPMSDRFKVEGEEMIFVVPDDIDDRTIIIDADTLNINLRTVYQNIYGTPESGEEVKCIVQSGVIVGSSSISTPAFEVGSWPSGVTINLRVDGRIQGRAGNGGRGAGFNFTGGFTIIPGTDGQAGGAALYSRYAINLSGAGQVWGGGGGGGGGGMTSGTAAGGGGGGQGRNGGAGGKGGDAPGNDGRDGAAGGSESAGAGGNDGNNASPGKGGNGGAAGQAGQNGSGDAAPGASGSWRVGGAAGRAIDGDSFITETGSLDVRGPRVN